MSQGNPSSCSRGGGADRLTALLISGILSCLPSPVHLAYACSAGTLGYHSLREMLQSGIPGTALLLESGDLRDVAVFPRPFLFLHTKDSVNKITVPPRITCEGPE